MNKVFVYGIFTDKVTRDVTLGNVESEYFELENYSTRQHNQVPYSTIYEKMGEKVEGLILKVDDEQLATMDRIEGVNFNLYQRKLIDPTNNLWVYME
jgi:gamma-glutamylcyclotransferase (GGCT)/AIG2-like uncharacterized protein YtfP